MIIIQFQTPKILRGYIRILKIANTWFGSHSVSTQMLIVLMLKIINKDNILLNKKFKKS